MAAKKNRVAELQDVTPHFARIGFYGYTNELRENGPHIGDITETFEHHAKCGWRPIAVWTSEGTWIVAILQRDA